MLTQHEAWLQIAAMIEGAPDMLTVMRFDPDVGYAIPGMPGGLCAVVARMVLEDAITGTVAERMHYQIEQLLKRRALLRRPPYSYSAYLTRKHCWRDGVRLQACLELAKEVQP